MHVCSSCAGRCSSNDDICKCSAFQKEAEENKIEKAVHGMRDRKICSLKEEFFSFLFFKDEAYEQYE